MKHHLKRNLGFLLIGIGPLWVVFGIYGLMQPDEFRASARIAVIAPDCGCLVTKNRFDQAHWDHRYEYYAALIKTIPPEAVLSNVTSELNLTSRWNKDRLAAINLLRHRLNVRLVPNTTLIKIGAVGESPADAALIANTVVKSYREFRRDEHLQTRRTTIVELKNQLAEEDKTIQINREALNSLRESLGIPETEIESVSLATNFPSFYRAKQTFEKLNDLRNLLARKIQIEENENLRTPPSVVEVLEEAVPPRSPFRRKKTLNVILIAAGLIGCGWGLKLVLDSRTPSAIA